MNFAKLVFNKYFGGGIKFVSKIISHKMVYLCVLCCLVTMDLNVNFLHEKMSVDIRKEVYYRINHMLDLENLKKIRSFTSFFQSIRTMVEHSQTPNLLFKVNRFNLHFLSESPMKGLIDQFDHFKDSMTKRDTNVEYMFLKEERNIIVKKARHEMILRFIGIDQHKLDSLDVGNRREARNRADRVVDNMPTNLVILLELGVNIMGRYYDSRNLIYFIEHRHLESTSFIEFELNFQTSYLWVYIVNTFFLIYILWKFILELIYSPMIGSTLMEFLFLLNFISIYSMEFTLKQSVSQLVQGDSAEFGYAELVDAYLYHSMLYSRYFIHGMFLFIKVFEVLMFNDVIFMFFCLLVSFCKNIWKMVKLFVFVFGLKIFVWTVINIFYFQQVNFSVNSLIILFSKFNEAEDYLGGRIAPVTGRAVPVLGLLHVLVQETVEGGFCQNEDNEVVE